MLTTVLKDYSSVLVGLSHALMFFSSYSSSLPFAHLCISSCFLSLMPNLFKPFSFSQADVPVVQGRSEADREEPPDQQQGEDARLQECQSGRQRPVLLLCQECSRTRLQQQQLHSQHYWCVCGIAKANVELALALLVEL